MLAIMNTNPIISLGLAVCVAMLIFVMYEQNFKRLILRIILSLSIILVLNTLLPEVYNIHLSGMIGLVIVALGWRGILLCYMGQWLWTMWG